MSASKQHKCALFSAGVCCILLGGAIAAVGFIFQYHDDYDSDKINGMGLSGGYKYYYTQYWLGLPVILLGVISLSLFCSKAKPLLYICAFLSFFTLTLAITGVVLEGPKWSGWLSHVQKVNDQDIKDVNGTCNLEVDGKLPAFNNVTCKEILHTAVMQSILVGSSILSIAIIQFVAFISMRILGRMSQSSYDIDNQHSYNGHTNLNVMSKM